MWDAQLAAGVYLVAELGLGHGLAALAFGGAAWLIVGSLAEIVGRCQVLRSTTAQSLARLRGTPLAAWSSAIAHAGMGITVAGIAGMSLSSSDVVTLRPGQTVHFSGYDWTLSNVHDDAGSNYRARVADLVVEHTHRACGRGHAPLSKVLRHPGGDHHGHSQTNGWRDLYTVLGGERDGQAVSGSTSTHWRLGYGLGRW